MLFDDVKWINEVNNTVFKQHLQSGFPRMFQSVSKRMKKGIRAKRDYLDMNSSEFRNFSTVKVLSTIFFFFSHITYIQPT